MQSSVQVVLVHTSHPSIAGERVSEGMAADFLKDDFHPLVENFDPSVEDVGAKLGHSVQAGSS